MIAAGAPRPVTLERAVYPGGPIFIFGNMSLRRREFVTPVTDVSLPVPTKYGT